MDKSIPSSTPANGDPLPPPPITAEVHQQRAAKYANLIATAINYCDVIKFQEKIQKFCVPMVKVVRRCSPSIPGTNAVPLHAQLTMPPSQLAQLQTTEHYGIEQFCTIMSDFNQAVPDGVMEVYDHKCYYLGDDYSVYVSSTCYTGTLFCPRFQPKPLGPSIDFPLAQMYMQGISRPLTVVGTMATYVLPNSYVYCIEFFYEYI